MLYLLPRSCLPCAPGSSSTRAEKQPLDEQLSSHLFAPSLNPGSLSYLQVKIYIYLPHGDILCTYVYVYTYIYVTELTRATYIEGLSQ